MAAAAPSASVLFGLPADASVDDIECLLAEAKETLSRIDAKRTVLQGQIAAASRARGKRRASRRPAAAGDDDVNGPLYARKGAGAVRRGMLRDAAGSAKKERKRMEAVCGDLAEALVDAKEFVALQCGGTV
jgi:hypothetical protein